MMPGCCPSGWGRRRPRTGSRDLLGADAACVVPPQERTRPAADVPRPAGAHTRQGAEDMTYQAIRPELEPKQLAIELLVTSARFTRLAACETPTEMPRALWRALAQLDDLGPARVSDLATADRVSQPTAT